MISFIPLNNLNNTQNLLIISEFTKLINETNDVIEYYSAYKKTKTNEGRYVDNLIFKLNAFEISLIEIKKYNYVIKNGNQLKKVKGIGKGTINRINYILKTGKLESEYPNLNEIYKIKNQLETQIKTEKVIQKEETEKVIQKENVELETEKIIKTEQTQTESVIKIEIIEIIELETESVIQKENVKQETEKVIKTENVEQETESVIKIEIIKIIELETEKDILGGCLSSTFSAFNNLKNVFCSFYNDIYVNFNEELKLNEKTD